MSTAELREQVLEMCYERLLDTNLEGIADNSFGNEKDGKKGTPPIVQLIVALENAQSNEQEHQLKQDELEQKRVEAEHRVWLDKETTELQKRDLAVKEDALAFDNAKHDIDIKHEDRREIAKLVISSAITVAGTVVWATLFAQELEQTRVFEVKGTETSAASRWLKSSFPKVKMF